MSASAVARADGPSLLELAEEILATEIAPRESAGDVTSREGFCTGCDKRVAVDEDDRCVWCAGPTALAMSRAERAVRLHRVCPSCRGAKSRGALQCRSCAGRRGRARRDPVSGRYTQQCGEEDFVCPDCGGAKSYNAKRCWGCYVARGGHRGRKHRKENSLRKLSDEVLLEAKRLYFEEGLSVRAVAARIFARTEYSSRASCAQALCDAFNRRGWRMRDRGEATAAANRRRAEERGLPFCTFVKANGERCHRRTSKGRCGKHNEANLRRLEELRRREGRRGARGMDPRSRADRKPRQA